MQAKGEEKACAIDHAACNIRSVRSARATGLLKIKSCPAQQEPACCGALAALPLARLCTCQKMWDARNGCQEMHSEKSRATKYARDLLR